MQTLYLANMMFASLLFPQTEKSPLEDIQKTLKHLLQVGFCINRKSFTTLPSPLRGGIEGGGANVTFASRGVNSEW